MITLYIKNMVCDRCKAAVARELEKHQITYQKIELGEVVLNERQADNKLQSFREGIEALGFEWIDDNKSKIIEKIKTEIIKIIHPHPQVQQIKTNFSLHLEKQIGKNYSTLSSLFSEVEGTTIEQYMIRQKIERVKELLVYDQYSLGQIANQLNYSSIQHLSNQFKKVTGLTPSHFKNLRSNNRKPLDKV